jgi:hydroxymethylglutaryl-CoA reductase
MFQNWNYFLLKTKQNSFSPTESITKTCKRGAEFDIVLQDKTNLLPNYYQLHATFETKDSMGANFINLFSNLQKH